MPACYLMREVLMFTVMSALSMHFTIFPFFLVFPVSAAHYASGRKLLANSEVTFGKSLIMKITKENLDIARQFSKYGNCETIIYGNFSNCIILWILCSVSTINILQLR